MKQYHEQLRHILDYGVWKEQRAVLKDGTKPRIRHVFGMQGRYDLSAGFPLVTTKRVNFKLVAEELFWFLSGSTNNNDLEARGVKIWREWCDPVTGDCGPIYGKQFRHWTVPQQKYEHVLAEPIDQIQELVNNINAVKANPHHKSGRRLILTAWNPADIDEMRGPFACHTLSHFMVTDGKLSCHMFQRSADMFLGVPFNIASYALLTHILAKVCGLEVGEFVHTISDAHIYENHIPQVEEQLTRDCYPLPKLWLNQKFALHGLGVEMFDLKNPRRYIVGEDVQLDDYKCHPLLKGEVAV